MDPFWNNIYDESKDRRYGTLFFATCIVVVASPFLFLLAGSAAGIFPHLIQFLTGYPNLNVFRVVCLTLAGGLFLVIAALLWRDWIRTRRKAYQERLKFSNLSRDELFKARSKLKSRMNPVKFRAVERTAKRRMPPRPRDVDIKY